MAATEKGVWDLQDVRDKQLQSEWSYTTDGDAGTLWGWGANNNGDMGHNNATDYSSPMQVGTENTWKTLSFSSRAYGANGAIKSDGTLWMMGSGVAGNLGFNQTSVMVSSPRQVGTDTDWSKLCAVYTVSAAIKTNGTLWMMGKNDGSSAGVLGQNNQTYRSSPTQVGTDTTWKKISMNTTFSFATKTDGTLWAWGDNGYGRLGLNQNTPVKISSPTQIGTDTTWNDIGVNEDNLVATKTDGTLWTWGRNNEGTLASNAPEPSMKSSPTQVGTGTDWSKAGGGYYTGHAIKTDGTMWVWGTNLNGGLGLNQGQPTITSASSPIQIPGTTWQTSGANYTMAGATKTDGTLWSWGNNPSGGLGLNDTVSRSSPTQIPGTWSSQLHVGWNNIMGIKI